MSERDYQKNLGNLGEVIEYMLNLSDEKYDEEKFKIISKHILEKYHKAFEELAK